MDPSKRRFLHFAVSTAAAGAVFSLTAIGGAEALPRPPGALEETDFLSFCSRCGTCIDACQPMALRPATLFEGLSNVGTPVMDVTRCVICMECIRKCPTGALSKIPKTEVDIGRVVIDKDLCLAWLGKKRCKDCYKACPTKAFTLEERRYPVLDPEKCNGCGICVRRCPTEPKAVTLSYQGARRYPRPAVRLATRLDDRVGPYEFPPPDFKTWLINRTRTLAESYGIVERGK